MKQPVPFSKEVEEFRGLGNARERKRMITWRRTLGPKHGARSRKGGSLWRNRNRRRSDEQPRNPSWLLETCLEDTDHFDNQSPFSERLN